MRSLSVIPRRGSGCHSAPQSSFTRHSSRRASGHPFMTNRPSLARWKWSLARDSAVSTISAVRRTSLPNALATHASAGAQLEAFSTSETRTGLPLFMIRRLAITTSRSLFASPGVGFSFAIAARMRAIAPSFGGADIAAPLARGRDVKGPPGERADTHFLARREE